MSESQLNRPSNQDEVDSLTVSSGILALLTDPSSRYHKKPRKEEREKFHPGKGHGKHCKHRKRRNASLPFRWHGNSSLDQDLDEMMASLDRSMERMMNDSWFDFSDSIFDFLNFSFKIVDHSLMSDSSESISVSISESESGSEEVDL